MDKSLRWKTHTSETVKRANRTLGLFCYLMPNRRAKRVQHETAWCHDVVWVVLWGVYLEQRHAKENPSREVPECPLKTRNPDHRRISPATLFVLGHHL
ncbi:hypothetical protein Trydic_g7284 [Trypoxylus dichotomus]